MRIAGGLRGFLALPEARDYAEQFMRLLDRYLLRELLIPLGYCLSGFLIFWVSFDLLSELSGFQEDGVEAIQIAWYYLFKAPELLVTIIPIALLLALLYALTNHARHNELTAMRAAGVSLPRLSLPYLAVGLAFSAVLFLLSEFWVPTGSEAAREIISRHGHSDPSPEDKAWHRNLHFRNSRDGRIWNIGAFNSATFQMQNAQVEWTLADRSQRLIAGSAARSNDCWVFFDVQEITSIRGQDADLITTQTNRLTVCEFSETPEQIQSEIKISRLNNFRTAKDVQLSIREILDYMRLHPDLNARDDAFLHTKLQERLAAPWTCIVVVLIALPFAAQTSRRNAFAGVASSVFICFGFFVLLRFGLALGTGGYVPPWLGAWLPNTVFAAAGVWLARRAR
jgi:lipopolysaccharide export system permease protein